MPRRNASVIVAALVMAAGALGSASTALGQVSNAVGFQGQLKSSGANVNAPADFRFSLWDAETGGNQVGVTDTQVAVSVADGLFNSSFDCGADPYSQNATRWLQVEVRTPSNGNPDAPGFVVMGGRQRLSATPYSLATRGMTVDPYGFARLPANTTTFGDATIGVTLMLDDIPGAKWAIQTSGYQLTFLSDGSGSFSPVSAMFPNGDFAVARDIAINRNLGVTGNVNVTGNQGISASANFSGNESIGLHLAGQNNGGCVMSFEHVGIGSWGVGILPGTSQLSFIPNRYPGGPILPPSVVMDWNGCVGINTTTPSASFRLDVAGNIRCVALTQTSSREFKQDIAPLSGALESVMKLRGVSYRWNDKAPTDVQGKRDIGFIADEMNDVLPDIVAKDEGGKPVGIDYGKVAAVEVEAIKQLKAENDRVKADNADLKARLEKIEAILAAQVRTIAK